MPDSSRFLFARWHWSGLDLTYKLAATDDLGTLHTVERTVRLPMDRVATWLEVPTTPGKFRGWFKKIAPTAPVIPRGTQIATGRKALRDFQTELNLNGRNERLAVIDRAIADLTEKRRRIEKNEDISSIRAVEAIGDR